MINPLAADRGKQWLGAVLVIARLVHAFGIKAGTMKAPGRFAGATATMLVVLVSSIWGIVRFLGH